MTSLMNSRGLVRCRVPGAPGAGRGDLGGPPFCFWASCFCMALLYCLFTEVLSCEPNALVKGPSAVGNVARLARCYRRRPGHQGPRNWHILGGQNFHLGTY